MFHLTISPTELPETHASFIINRPVKVSLKVNNLDNKKNEEQQTCNHHEETILIDKSLFITNSFSSLIFLVHLH